MKSKLIILAIAVIIIPVTSCLEDLQIIRGNGIVETQTRRSGNFYKVENSTSIDVIYKKADTTGITIRADENIIGFIITETFDNTLEIKIRPNNTILHFNERPLIIITSPRLEAAYISGSGTLIADEISGNAVSLRMSGSGDISADQVTCTDLSVMLSGSGNINLKNSLTVNSDLFLSGSGTININGHGTSCHLKNSGSGRVYVENFILKIATATISGSGDVYMNVEDSLVGTISGSGNIYLKGNPEISQTVSGSGRIIKYK